MLFSTSQLTKAYLAGVLKKTPLGFFEEQPVKMQSAEYEERWCSPTHTIIGRREREREQKGQGGTPKKTNWKKISHWSLIPLTH